MGANGGLTTILVVSRLGADGGLCGVPPEGPLPLRAHRCQIHLALSTMGASQGARESETHTPHSQVTTVTGEQDKFQVCSKLSATTLNLEVDSGSTQAESGAWVCLEFARGCCLKGHECTALHRVPTVDECKAFAVDAHHDVFGRDRRPADIPSYMPDEESRAAVEIAARSLGRVESAELGR